MPKPKRRRRLASLLFLTSALVTLPAAAPARAVGVEPDGGSRGGDAIDTPLQILESRSHAAPADKIQPSLRDSVAAAPEGEVYLVVRSARPVDLRAFDPHVHAFTWPAGEHLAVLKTAAANIGRIAALPGVASVESGDPFGASQLEAPLAEDPMASWKPADAAWLHQRLDEVPAWSETAVGRAEDARRARRDDVARAPRRAPGADLEAVDLNIAGAGAAHRTDGLDAWYDTGPGHGTSDAWRQGFRGEGVTVAVLDTGVDFGHPDMHGAWKVLPEGHPYGGWPQAYDPGGTYYYMLDTNEGSATSLTRTANGGVIQMYQTSDVVEQEVSGTMRKTACFRPLRNNRQLGEDVCTYIVPESKSGKVRYGHHPDPAFVQARSEFMGVLLVDAERPGLYDTVYVDLDGDRDFTDEKAVDRDSPLSWRDADDDGVADLSGGLLYYIADGELPVPGAYLWGIEDRVPAAGSVVAFFYDTGNHGTLCASNVVSQGRLGVPPEVNLTFEDLPGGKPAVVNPGAAPDARLVGVIVFTGPSQIVIDSAWRYVTLGHDPDRDDDAIQISSNSYVFSGAEDSSWNSIYSRPIDFYNQKYSPFTLWTGGTGNGGPGYGTTMVPLPAASVKVAGTTQFGSTGADSITRSDQITFGDIVPFSNRGPLSDGRTGPDIAADGANAAGGVPINLIFNSGAAPQSQRNGRYANVTWGGTSRSGPVQAGNLALVYQAFKHKHDRWPSWQEAQAALMAGARWTGYDPFATGAGALDAGDATRIASGAHGVYAMPPKWTAGAFRGKVHTVFPRILTAGQADTGRIRLVNPSDHPIDVTIGAQAPRKIGSIEGTIETRAAALSSPGTQLAPDYLAAIDRDDIPAGTELMAVRAVYPLEQADPNSDFFLDRAFALAVYRHTDRDGDGRLWEDRDGNGVVNHAFLSGVTKGLDRAAALDYASTEVDEGEYVRFASTNQHASNLQVWVHHPIERWGDGIHVGLFNTQVCFSADNCVGRGTDIPDLTVRYRVDFYKWERWGWLSLSTPRLTVPAGGEATFDATLAVPAGAALGAYQGAVFADFPRAQGDAPVAIGGGWEMQSVKRVVIPVNANVAAAYDWTGGVTLGGEAGDDRAALYNNGAVYGGQAWTWRAESGDWRHFFFDMARPQPGTYLVARTRWQDPNKAGLSDIDTRIWGPTMDDFSRENPDWFGPHSMTKIAESPFLHVGSGRYAFNTSTGGNDDWVVAPAGEGLHEVTLHNVRSSGTLYEMPFETAIGSLRVEPSPIQITGNHCRTANLTSGIDLPGVKFVGAGLSVPTTRKDVPISQTNQAGAYKEDVRLDQPARYFEVAITGRPTDDLDLFIVFDRDGDGQFNAQTETIAVANGPQASERIQLRTEQPAGRYQVWVQGASVAGGTSTFDLDIRALSGDNVRVVNPPSEIQGGRTYPLEVCVSGVDLATAPAEQAGAVILGPAGAPTMLVLPVRWGARSAPRGLFLPALLASGMFESEGAGP